MSHTYAKTKYKEEIYYGSSCGEEEHILYVHHNHSCDITSFFDEKGKYILSFPDTLKNNIFDAMKKLNFPFKETWNGELAEGVEKLTPEDFKIIGR